MAHFAKVINGIVQEVLVIEQDVVDSGIVGNPDLWIQTSYNTRGGIHYQPDSNIPSIDQSKALRKNYAGIGYIYDKQRDAFISPKPFNSWILNEQTCLWDPPIPYPNDDKEYTWDELTISWKEIANG